VQLVITGQEIKAARQRAGWSRERFAELVGVHPKTVANWESGRTEPRDSEYRIKSALAAIARPAEEPTERDDLLRSVSSIELVGEIARRLARQGQREEGDSDAERDAASIGDEIGQRRHGAQTAAERGDPDYELEDTAAASSLEEE
jgi:transcriptional regulator with XRE-family HTH domain